MVRARGMGASDYRTRMPAPAYFRHPSSLEHDTGMHPEGAARVPAIERELAARDWLGWEKVDAPALDRDGLLAVHTEAHVEFIESLTARGGGAIDIDTVASAGSWNAALHSAGGAVAMVDRLLEAEGTGAGFCGLRPPGHHAEPDRAMGFCLFNNVAMAARHALDRRHCERVMIVDWDVHHGNGTEAVFWESAEVLFISIHQWPLYPGTGAAGDVGAGQGRGHTVNLPVPAGSGDGEFCALVAHVAAPLARAFRPELLLISAGFDAHAADPLASCRTTEGGYRAMAALLRGVAEELAIPVGAVLEGGYDLDALARSVAATLEGLAGGVGPPEVEPRPLATQAAERVREHWPALEPA
jgi:acetoin utilization deacetylase AcuC-like enzyme